VSIQQREQYFDASKRNEPISPLDGGMGFASGSGDRQCAGLTAESSDLEKMKPSL
jgi:hypothetical protein